ncbi:MAG: DUF4215 domain-containing protein [bacterium]
MQTRSISLTCLAALALAAWSCAENNTVVPDPECGNGVIETGEQCDGNELGSGSCLALGFETGILTCDSYCQFDTQHCENIERDCGNGLLDGGEGCDDANLENNDGCDFNCNVEPGFTCEGEPSVCTGNTCGNGVVDGDDECELGDLDGQTCLSLGFDGGMLSCRSDCTFNVSSCTGGPCGNGNLDYGEECDTDNLALESCATLGFEWGALACDTDCAFDTSGCSNDPCGNGTKDATEACDGADLDGQDCVDQGFLYGTLACGTDCAFDTSGCSNDPCGNGAIDSGEQCDGADLNGQDCVDQGFYWGTLACAAGCTFDTSGCSSDPCGNNAVNAGEDCDGTDLDGEDCVSRGFLTGTLACAAGCTFDTSGCAHNICGNANVEPGEQCDDGNTAPGDGCSPTCQWEGQCTADYTLTCGVGVSGALLMAPDDITGYSCGTAAAALGDHVYSFVAGATGLANASLNVIEEDPVLGDDIDLYVLEGACVPSQCIAAGNTWGDELFTFPVTAGMTYYVVVETVYWGLISQLDYDLNVNCP